MLSDILKNYVPLMILSLLFCKDSYAYQLNKDIYESSNNGYEVNEGTLYTTMKKMEAEKYIVSYWGDSEVGARRKMYKITADGKLYLTHLQNEFSEANKILDKIIKGEKE